MILELTLSFTVSLRVTVKGYHQDQAYSLMLLVVFICSMVKIFTNKTHIIRTQYSTAEQHSTAEQQSRKATDNQLFAFFLEQNVMHTLAINLSILLVISDVDDLCQN